MENETVYLVKEIDEFLDRTLSAIVRMPSLSQQQYQVLACAIRLQILKGRLAETGKMQSNDDDAPPSR